MDHQDHNASRVQSPVTRNPWSAFVPTSARDVYRDPPTDEATLQRALSAWQDTFGGRQVTLGIKAPVRFEQGTVLGGGGLGAVYETTLGGVAVAWKRVYTRRLTDWHLNEIKILGQIAEDRHKHIITFIGSYVQRQRNSTYEVAIFTWPVAKCDLAILLHQVDLMYEWKKRDKAWDEHDPSDSPTEEEKAAYDNLLELVELDHERHRTFTWKLREKLLKAVSQRLQRSVGCIAEAVKYLHSHNIRHKDIKPSQILLSTRSLWLTDFGWSKDISQLQNSQTSGGDRITIKYHAPERAQLGKCGRPEDIFALGCTFLEMSYPIYGIRAADYINPVGALMWSFQLNLRHIHSWLAPLIVRDSRTDWPLLFQNLIREMMREDPSDRPVIEDILVELQRKNRSTAMFGDCCQPPLTPLCAETNSEKYNKISNHFETDDDIEGSSNLSDINEDVVHLLQDDRQMLAQGNMDLKEDFDRSDGEEESSSIQTRMEHLPAHMTDESCSVCYHDIEATTCNLCPQYSNASNLPSLTRTPTNLDEANAMLELGTGHRPGETTEQVPQKRVTFNTNEDGFGRMIPQSRFYRIGSRPPHRDFDPRIRTLLADGRAAQPNEVCCSVCDQRFHRQDARLVHERQQHTEVLRPAPILRRTLRE